MADPGLGGGGGAPTPKVGVLTYFFGRKLHENERIWGQGRVPGAPLDPPLYKIIVSEHLFWLVAILLCVYIYIISVICVK